MSLTAPATVFPGVTFPLTVISDPAPSVEISGFAAEVLFPAGLEYSGSGDCQEEIQVERVDGGSIAFCLSTLAGSGGRVINVSSAVAAPPLPALDLAPGASGVALATFAFTCTAVGDYKVTLASNPPSPDGAVYADLFASPIGVKAETQNGGDVADTLLISCVELLTAMDSDGDGCTNGAEMGQDQKVGGRRNPLNFWDFFDTPDTANVRDKAIAFGDILRVMARWGTVGDPNIDPRSPPGQSGYHPAYDRTSGGPNIWNLGPPNGAISLQDVVLVIAQFGHICA